MALRCDYSQRVKSSLNHNLHSLNLAYLEKASIGDFIEASANIKKYFASPLLGVTTLLEVNACWPVIISTLAITLLSCACNCALVVLLLS